MKKIFLYVITPFFILFFIWCMVIWINYPNFIQDSSHYHLNLYEMLSRFSDSGVVSDSFINVFKSFVESMKKINTSSPWFKVLANNVNKAPMVSSNAFGLILGAVNALIDPIYSIVNVVTVLGYLIVLILEFLSICTALASAIIDFIFNPVIIYIP